MYNFFSQAAHLARSCGARETEGKMGACQQGQPPTGCLVYPNGWRNDTVFGAFSTHIQYTHMNSPVQATCNSASSQRHFSQQSASEGQQETMPNQRDIFFLTCLEPRRKGSCIHVVTVSRYPISTKNNPSIVQLFLDSFSL